MKRILILKLGALGDVVMSTPVIKAIQKHHQHDEIHLLTSTPFLPLFANWKGINVSAIDRTGVLSIFKMILKVRKSDYDYVYDLQSSDRTRVVLSASGIRNRIGNHPAWPYTVSPTEKYSGEQHIFERLNEVLTAASVPEARPPAHIPSSQQDIDELEDWLFKQELTEKPFVLMHAGASPKHPEKRWPYYLQLAEQLSSLNISTIWLGSESETDMNKRLAATTGINATNVFSLRQLPLLAKYAIFSVTNDSGPMHLLSAGEKPVFAFFGTTNWRRNHALGQEKFVITRQPGSVSGKRLSNPEYALSRISVDEVMAKIQAEKLL